MVILQVLKLSGASIAGTTVAKCESTDKFNIFPICAVLICGNECQLQKKKKKSDSRGKVLCRKISASATTICIAIKVQEIASLREHVVTGSLDQSQGSTQTSGATKKLKYWFALLGHSATGCLPHFWRRKPYG